MSGDAYYLSLLYARQHVRWARKTGIWSTPIMAYQAIDREPPEDLTWEHVIEVLAVEWRKIMAA